jgi:hypothetical protein
MVSRMQFHERLSGAPHAPCSVLTRAVCVVLCAVKRAAVDLLQTTCRSLAE